ncbi:MAG TPA: asparaginase [Blastocatellia bacterium]|nr:asparaginase [Blastocatellia bacterium]
MDDRLPVLAEVRRGAIVEARHRGAIVVAEPDGRIVARLGDAELATSTRSTIKPIQALPLVISGAADRFQFSSRELAVACASHDGEPIHTETVARMLERIGLDETALRCGAHAPYNEEAARALEAEGRPFTQIHNNCSGKHAGMLATALHNGVSIEDYVSPAHPVQRGIITTLVRLGDLAEPLPTAVDGCSAPTFAVPLRSLALAFARLVNPWNGHSPLPLGSDFAEAAKRVVAAMTAHPEMVGGTKDRLDTDLMRAARGALICKVGAEAVYSIGVLPCSRFPRGVGIAIKMEDGSYRGLGPAVIETLAQLGVLDQSQQAQLTSYHHPVLKNRREVEVGEVRPAFDLEFNRKSYE